MTVYIQAMLSPQAAQEQGSQVEADTSSITDPQPPVNTAAVLLLLS